MDLQDHLESHEIFKRFLDDAIKKGDLDACLTLIHMDFGKIPRDILDEMESLFSRPTWTRFDAELEKRGAPLLFYQKMNRLHPIIHENDETIASSPEWEVVKNTSSDDASNSSRSCIIC